MVPVHKGYYSIVRLRPPRPRPRGASHVGWPLQLTIDLVMHIRTTVPGGGSMQTRETGRPLTVRRVAAAR